MGISRPTPSSRTTFWAGSASRRCHMSKKNASAIRNQIAKLQRELDNLKSGAPDARKYEPAHQNNCLGHTIARGVKVTTRTGSLYTTLLRLNAALGHLDNQEQLFGNFNRTGTAAAA